MKTQRTQPDELHRILTHAFRMRPALRTVFLLCDIRGLTIAETAALLGIAPIAVSIRLARARGEMKARLAGPIGQIHPALPQQ